MLTTPPPSTSRLRDEHGFTLIEVLLATVLGLIVSAAAFSLLEFTTRDVSRITERAHATQAARTTLENIMLQLHSACVAVGTNPIQAGSSGTELEFISESSPLNANKEPISALSTVRLRKIVYTPPSGNTEGRLTERSWPSLGQPPEYEPWGPTASERLLVKGISAPKNEKGEALPIFQYYRYYEEGDTEPKYGQIDPTPVGVPLTNPTGSSPASSIAKVAVDYTVAPEGKENSFAKGDRAIALEDSATLRMATTSEAPSASNEPCTQIT